LLPLLLLLLLLWPQLYPFKYDHYTHINMITFKYDHYTYPVKYDHYGSLCNHIKKYKHHARMETIQVNCERLC